MIRMHYAQNLSDTNITELQQSAGGTHTGYCTAHWLMYEAASGSMRAKRNVIQYLPRFPAVNSTETQFDS